MNTTTRPTSLIVRDAHGNPMFARETRADSVIHYFRNERDVDAFSTRMAELGVASHSLPTRTQMLESRDCGFDDQGRCGGNCSSVTHCSHDIFASFDLCRCDPNDAQQRPSEESSAAGGMKEAQQANTHDFHEMVVSKVESLEIWGMDDDSARGGVTYTLSNGQSSSWGMTVGKFAGVATLIAFALSKGLPITMGAMGSGSIKIKTG